MGSPFARGDETCVLIERHWRPTLPVAFQRAVRDSLRKHRTEFRAAVAHTERAEGSMTDTAPECCFAPCPSETPEGTAAMSDGPRRVLLDRKFGGQ